MPRHPRFSSGTATLRRPLMNGDEIRSRFDGRGRVEFRLDASALPRAKDIAHALGYRLLSSGRVSRWVHVLVFQRDDDPRARRRAEQTIERLRAGGPVLPDGELPAPPPPPPAPAPPLAPRQPEPRPRRSLEPQPPPPVGPPAAGLLGPRIPSRPPYPPLPPPPPSATPESSEDSSPERRS